MLECRYEMPMPHYVSDTATIENRFLIVMACWTLALKISKIIPWKKFESFLYFDFVSSFVYFRTGLAEHGSSRRRGQLNGRPP